MSAWQQVLLVHWHMETREVIGRPVVLAWYVLHHQQERLHVHTPPHDLGHNGELHPLEICMISFDHEGLPPKVVVELSERVINGIALLLDGGPAGGSVRELLG